eukprot:COSAG01_NODE_9869_length_2316_cov_6.950725_3_plen_162_part_00
MMVFSGHSDAACCGGFTPDGDSCHAPVCPCARAYARARVCCLLSLYWCGAVHRQTCIHRLSRLLRESVEPEDRRRYHNICWYYRCHLICCERIAAMNVRMAPFFCSKTMPLRPSHSDGRLDGFSDVDKWGCKWPASFVAKADRQGTNVLCDIDKVYGSTRP